MADPGWVVILNGAPRSGKTSIAQAIIELSDEFWMNIGVDAMMASMDAEFPEFRPGIGLRPGWERPDLEAFVEAQYRALFVSIAHQARFGANIVADLGLHRSYAGPLDPFRLVAQRLGELPVLLVGVRCPLEEIMRRRNAEPEGSSYARSTPDEEVPEPVKRWQIEVHRNVVYDLEIDTSVTTPSEAAAAILAALHAPPKSPAIKLLDK